MGNQQNTSSASRKSSSNNTFYLNEADAKTRNNKINQELRNTFKEESKYIKLLVLGAGESGKSTIIKQMKLIHPNVDGREQAGFTDKERLIARVSIYRNIVDSMSNLLDAIQILNIEGWEKVVYLHEKEGNQSKIVKVIEDYSAILRKCGIKKHGEVQILDEEIIPTREIVDTFKYIWKNEVIQKAYARRSEFQLNDSTSYFMTHLDRLCAADYQPNDQDVLRSRVKTTGVSKIEFPYKGIQFRMFDVGGQRSERKKWIHCFDNVTAILFVVNIAV